MGEDLKKTPLHSFHQALKARLVPFAGYEMPVQYTGVLEESQAVRKSAGLFDVSHMGQFALRGTKALQSLDKLVTNNLAKVQVGQAQYNILCKEDGGTLDDLVIYRRGEDFVYICVNAANRDKDFTWMKEHLDGLSLEDESEQTALLALQGPKAPEILKALGVTDSVTNLTYYWGTESILAGIDCFISRTGYTGEDGFEIYVPADHAGVLWEQLLEVGNQQGLVPAGLASRDILRTEMGYPLYGHELNDTLSPIAANLKWVVKLKKSDFIGKAALQKEHEAGAAKQLKGFVIEDRRMARPGYPIVSQGQIVGEVSSGVFSPHVDKPIALGFVKKDYAGSESFEIRIRKDSVPAKVTRPPFVTPGTKS